MSEITINIQHILSSSKLYQNTLITTLKKKKKKHINGSSLNLLVRLAPF